MKFALCSMLLVLVSAAAASAECTGFKEGALANMTVDYVKSFRNNGKTVTDVTKAEVVWNPNDMLDDPNCYALTETQLLNRKDPQDNFDVVKVNMTTAGADSKWILKEVKPCLQYEFAIRIVAKDEQTVDTVLTLPQKLGPLDFETILNNTFQLEPPTDLVSEVGASMADLYWEPSVCARMYDVKWAVEGKQPTGETFVTVSEPSISIGNLQACTKYDVYINAKLNEKDKGYSDDYKTSIATKPRLDAMDKVEVSVSAITLDSALVSWNIFPHVPCVFSFDLELCYDEGEEKCLPEVNVKPASGLNLISYSLEKLEACTDYVLNVKPLYPDEEMSTKQIEFRTSSPNATEVNVESVDAEVVSANQMRISWPNVQCATSYKVYQKQVNENEDQEWEELGSVIPNEMTADNLTPCQDYVFAVSAVLDDVETDKKESSRMTSELDESSEYRPPNRDIDNRDKEATFTWDHAGCIDSYKLTFTQAPYSDPSVRIVDKTSINAENKVVYTLTDLSPCTQYTVTIMPVIGSKTFEKAISFNVTTTNGTPVPPDNLAVESKGSGALLKWDKTQCSTGYNVTNKSDDVMKFFVNDGNNEHFADKLRACQTYEFAVSSVVGEQQSQFSEPKTLTMPPDLTQVPEMQIVSNENGNVTLTLERSEANKLCQPIKYELLYSSTGNEPFDSIEKDAAEVEAKNGDIDFFYEGANEPDFVVKARILFAEPDKWSEWVSSQRNSANDASQVHALSSSQSSLQSILPIVVVCLVLALVIAAVVIFVIVRSKCTSNRSITLDHEKGKPGKKDAEEDEERQKLNDDDRNAKE